MTVGRRTDDETWMPLDAASPISVVIPMFEAERFIERALHSVAAQTVRARAVVVVDDGSTDDGPRLVTACQGVRLIRQPNAGAGAARNTGVAATTSPWVAFLDADDVWSPTHLAALLRIIADVPEAGLVSTRHRQVRDARTSGRPRGGWRQQPRRGRRIDYFRRAGRRIGVVWSSAAAVRRTAFDEIGGFAHLSGPEDIQFWARVALRHPVATSRSLTAHYVRGTGGIMERAATVPHRVEAEWVPLRSLTHSIRSIVHEAELRRPDVPLRSLELYIDGRVTSSWRQVLVAGDQPAARRRRVELHHPLHWSAWPYLAAARLPTPVGHWLATTRRRMIAPRRTGRG